MVMSQVYVLFLNDMRSSNIEILEPVARASSVSALESLLSKERVPAYSDGNWGKAYRKGGPLEWFNEPSDYTRSGIREVMSPEDAAASQEAKLRRIPSVETLFFGAL